MTTGYISRSFVKAVLEVLSERCLLPDDTYAAEKRKEMFQYSEFFFWSLFQNLMLSPAICYNTYLKQLFLLFKGSCNTRVFCSFWVFLSKKGFFCYYNQAHCLALLGHRTSIHFVVWKWLFQLHFCEVWAWKSLSNKTLISSRDKLIDIVLMKQRPPSKLNPACCT